MDISFELIRLVNYAANQAIGSVLNTDGPLLSFMCMSSMTDVYGHNRRKIWHQRVSGGDDRR